MFGNSRRHRPPNPPLTSATANPNAASAAASAFMSASNQKPNKSLSSAAAAAALRARPHTPTNVGEVQTKRTIRRSTSVSSTGSAGAAVVGTRPTAQLQRKSSSGSMTERTFRSPSPRRSSSIPAIEEQPPVPQIPVSHKKSASVASGGMGMQTFRTASQKMKTTHPSWYTEPSGNPANVRTSDAPMKTSKPQLTRPQFDTTSPQRPDSRSSSVNFSYPTGFRTQSPPASPTSAQAPQPSGPPPRVPASPPRSTRASISSITSGKSDQLMVYDPNSRRMVPKAVENVGHNVNDGAERQPRKKRYGGTHREGSHLTKGTVARIKGTTIDANAGERNLPRREQPVVESSPTRDESRILEEPAVEAIITTAGPNEETPKDSQILRLREPEETTSISPPSQRASYEPSSTLPITGDFGKDSNVAEEEPEVSESEDDNIIRPSQKVLDALDAVPTRQSIFEQPESNQLSIQNTDAAIKKLPANGKPPEQAQSTMTTEKRTSFAENKPVAGLSKEGSGERRSSSYSPARQARFSATPSDNLAVRHTPLPRSASPIKSALKRNSPTRREVSPSEYGSEVSGSRGVSPYQREDSASNRKKSVRVSFDERTMATVVGESASAGDTDEPVPPSPQQVKRPWYSNIGRSKRKEFTLEDDEVMKPRPALPSFGSVRERKLREPEERPLVRPQDSNNSPAMPSSPELRPSSPSTLGDAGVPEESPLGQSNDHAIGPILTQAQTAQTTRNAPNISRFREPLPPVVTSVEGSGYISDSIRSSDSDDDLLNSVGGASDTEEIPSTQATQLESHENSQNNSTVLEKEMPTSPEVKPPDTIHLPPHNVPEITVIQPSPRAPEHIPPVAGLIGAGHYFDVPGRFPDEEPGSEDQPSSKNLGGSTSPSPPPIFEPKAVVQPIQSETLPQTTLATTSPLDAAEGESTDNSDASIYSDAHEDLSDVEGDGFLSLNAVVEKPIHNSTRSDPQELLGDTPEKSGVTHQAGKQSGIAIRSSGTAQDGNEWEQAKAYWRSLTAEKRFQLEREAMEEAGTEGDQEETSRPVRRNSSRKKTARKQPTVQGQAQTAKAPLDPDMSKATTPTNPGLKVNQDRATPPPTSSRMRASLRPEKPRQANGLRKTMRSQSTQSRTGHTDQPSARQNLQREKPSPTATRPDQKQKLMAPAQILPAKKPETILPNKPTLQRRGSDASDSSFKRTRATRGGGFNLRSSMRPTSAGPSHETTKGSGRFSLRSLSPTGSAFRHGLSSNAVSGTAAPPMRQTLRSSSVSSQERILPSIHLPSFGRSGKASTAKRSKRTSRLGDSSDEEEGGLPGFRSRFADSSDEDGARPGSSSQAGPLSRGTLRSSAGPAGFRKSTPVPEVEEESPELPDSDDEMPSPLQSPQNRASIGRQEMTRSTSGALGTGTLTRSRSGRGGFNTSVSTPTTPTRERRSSLMGILRRNKRADATNKIQRSEVAESAARRDTRLERSSEQLRDLREQSASPRLQKRNSVKRSDSWPLGEAGEVEGVKRSNSAGNLLNQSSTGIATPRPDLQSRRSTSLGIPTAHDDEPDNMPADGSGQRKKKKFGALRRMFGLDD
ncbi:hypothetical protein M426DRAFT_256195 [Hypoxylon sp. CI-4A]|nr:hypothetical protein M426DRAFT_256195 [Hypoxylon sp. CI-4A]